MNLLLEKHIVIKPDLSVFNLIQLASKIKFRIKPIYFFIIAILLSFSQIARAQSPCDAVSVEVFGMNPQTGFYSYFGVRVSISQTYSQNITVSGYIWDGPDEHGYNENHPYTLTIVAGSLSAETPVTFYQTGPAAEGAANITSVSPCPVPEITATYAGVTITYEVYNHILRFNSTNDFNSVVDQLEADYDTYNDNYDAQYPNLTPEQMDDIDVTNNFDEFATYKNFENLFSGFISKRSQIESTENAWISSDFMSTDPDDIDLTFDDAINTVFNSDNAFKVGNDIYQLTADGLYINGTLQVFVKKPFHSDLDFASYKVGENIGIYRNALLENNEDEELGPTCQTNKKNTGFPQFGNDKYKFKVALTSLSFRSTVKSKVKHFAYKNGHWKHTRAEMAVFIGGRALNSLCNEVASFSTRKPSPNGWKKRRQLKVHIRDTNIVWKANPGDVVGSFDTALGNSAGISLTW